MKKKVLGILLIFLITCVVGSGWHYLTAGFRLNKIEFDLPINPHWDFDLAQGDFENVQSILSQKFTYLGKGRQSYVFASDDGKYVIKFFRYHLVRPRVRHYLMQFPKKINEYRKYRLFGKKMQFHSWMDSYSLAFKELKEETGICYMHLTNTEGRHNKKIEIVDGIGRSYVLDADRTGFLIQKRVDLLFDRVTKLTKEKDFDHLARVIRAYLVTVGSRYQKGIKNKDHAWTHNYGIVGYDEVYEIDAGRYSPQAIDQDLPHFQITLMRFTFPLQEYFKANVPEFMPTFNQLLIEESKKHFPDA